MAKYKFTPLDFYNYILLYDLRFSEQNRIIEDFFRFHNSELTSAYRNNLKLLRKEINNIKICNTAIDGELNEVAIILNELKVKYKFGPQKDDYLFADYFKMVKMQLLYSGITYKKVKLKTLLQIFGYKRRSEQIKKDIINSITALQLTVYHGKCKLHTIDKIKLDTMLSIKLDNTKRRLR